MPMLQVMKYFEFHPKLNTIFFYSLIIPAIHVDVTNRSVASLGHRILVLEEAYLFVGQLPSPMDFVLLQQSDYRPPSLYESIQINQELFNASIHGGLRAEPDPTPLGYLIFGFVVHFVLFYFSPLVT